MEIMFATFVCTLTCQLEHSHTTWRIHGFVILNKYFIIFQRETTTSSAEVTSSLDQTIGEKHHRVTICLSVHPDPGAGLPSNVDVVPNKDSDLATKLRKHHLKAVNSGVRNALSRGTSINLQYELLTKG